MEKQCTDAAGSFPFSLSRATPYSVACTQELSLNPWHCLLVACLPSHPPPPALLLPPGLGCVSPEKRAQVPTRPGCSLAGWLIGPHLDLIRHGAPPEASAAFIAHSADLDRRKMAADMLHFLGSCLKAVKGPEWEWRVQSRREHSCPASHGWTAI